MLFCTRNFFCSFLLGSRRICDENVTRVCASLMRAAFFPDHCDIFATRGAVMMTIAMRSPRPAIKNENAAHCAALHKVFQQIARKLLAELRDAVREP
jgi:hypothetical protein